MKLMGLTAMPREVVLALSVFTLLPFIDLGALAKSLNAMDPGLRLCIICAHGIGPWLISVAIVKKSPLVAPLYLIEMVSLSALLLLVPSAGQGWMVAKFLSVGGIALATFAVANADVLAPFFAVDARQWRRSSRQAVVRKVAVVAAGSGHRLPGFLRDISLTGLGIVMSEENARSLIAADAPVSMRLDFSPKVPMDAIDASLVWHRSAGDLTFLGLKTSEESKLRVLLRDLGVTPPQVRRSWAPFFRRPLVQRVSMAAWLVSLISAFLLSAFGK